MFRAASVASVFAICTCGFIRHVLFTRVDEHDTLAHFALHVATPVELAAAPFRDLRLARRVSTAAAHQVATGYSVGVPVAPSTDGAERTRLVVRRAVVRRLLQIDKVFLVHLTEARVGADEFRAAPSEAHSYGTVVTLAQSLADETEARLLVPASLQAARSRHTVALAGDLRVAVQRLQWSRSIGYATIRRRDEITGCQMQF